MTSAHVPADPVAREPIPTSVRIGYGAGSVATGAFGTVPGLMLLPFLTDSLGVASLWAAVIVFAPKFWDVLLNPVAGRISDRHVSAAGPRRPFLIRAGLGLALCFALIFAGPATGSTAVDATWVVVCFVLAATCFAFFQVPYVSMPAEITDSYHERTRLMTWRVVILAVTILVAGASAPAIRDAVGGREGYRAMGVVMAVLIAVGVTAAWWGTRHAPIQRVEASTGSLRDALRVVARTRDFRLLVTTYMLQAMAAATMLAGVDYLAKDVLGSQALVSVLFVCLIGPALVLTPVWARIGERLGKKRGFLASSTLLGLGAVAASSAQHTPHAVTFAAVALVGVGYAGCQVFPMAMMPDTAAIDSMRTGENRVGVYTGVWTALETFGMALGPGVFGVCGLWLGGYVSSTSGGLAQSADTLTAITLAFSLVPALLMALSMISLSRYRLDAAEVEAARRHVADRAGEPA